MGLAYRAGRMARFLWSGWAGLAGLAVFAAVWQLGAEAYGSFVLPTPADTIQTLFGLASDPDNRLLVLSTSLRAISGFAAAAHLGRLQASLPDIIRRHAACASAGDIADRVPPIAWIVLLMIWFGMGPARSLRPLLSPPCHLSLLVRPRHPDAGPSVGRYGPHGGLSPLARLFRISLRQMLHSLFPSLVMALGTAFKAAVMAELLANAGGIGGALANARSRTRCGSSSCLDPPVGHRPDRVEYGIVQPLRAEAEAWREAAQPWGVRR